jgi:outer membrane lipoprotein-sorting protein
MNRPLLLLAIGIVLGGWGCGLKPEPSVPVDISVERVLAALRAQSDAIVDFTGAGKATVRDSRGERSSGIIFRFGRPDLFTLNIRGFGGMELASVGSDGDSLTFFIPSMNGFLRTGKNSRVIGMLVPNIDDDIVRLAPIAAGILPMPEPADRYAFSLETVGGEAELTASRGGEVYRYRVSGPDLRIVAVRFDDGAGTVWSVRRSGFRSTGGYSLPRDVVWEGDSRTLSIHFSTCAVNTGLTPDDLSPVIPDDAERLMFPGAAVR